MSLQIKTRTKIGVLHESVFDIQNRIALARIIVPTMMFKGDYKNDKNSRFDLVVYRIKETDPVGFVPDQVKTFSFSSDESVYNFNNEMLIDLELVMDDLCYVGNPSGKDIIVVEFYQYHV